ncbi:MAG: DUF2971 domain-containing protein [Peptostreptococcaceae bacterium]
MIFVKQENCKYFYKYLKISLLIQEFKWELVEFQKNPNIFLIKEDGVYKIISINELKNKKIEKYKLFLKEKNIVVENENVIAFTRNNRKSSIYKTIKFNSNLYINSESGINDKLQLLLSELNTNLSGNKLCTNKFSEIFCEIDFIFNDIKLFKYYNPYKDNFEFVGHFNDIMNGSLKFSAPDEFNDPFDSNFYVALIETILLKINLSISSFKYELIYKKLHLFFRDFFKYKGKDNKNKCIDEIYIEITSILEKDKINHVDYSLVKRSISNLIENLVEFSEWFRILSTTKKHDNILMWSYYAKEHKGLCQEFSFSNIIDNVKKNSFENEKISKLPLVCFYGEVKYSSRRPPVTFIMCKNPTYFDIIDMIEKMQRSIFTKYKEWSHEQEFRISFLGDFKEETVILKNNKILNRFIGTNAAESLQLKLKASHKMKKHDNKFKLI